MSHYLPKVSSRLTIEAVYDEEIVLIGSPPMASEATGARKSSDLQSFSFVTYEEGNYVFGKWFDAIFGKQPTSIRSEYHFDELEEVVTFVGLGKGLSILPLDAARGAIQSGAVRVIRPVRRRCTNSVFCVARASSSKSPELSEVLASIRAGAQRSGRRTNA